MFWLLGQMMTKKAVAITSHHIKSKSQTILKFLNVEWKLRQ